MIYSRSIAALAIALCCLLAASPGHAQETQGKTGTTITFDGNSSKGLFSKSASTNTVPLYAYARHIQTNINFISVNSDGGTIDITTGLFTNTANNILYTTDAKIALGMNSSSTYRPAYYGIVAPKGYRIIRVTLDIDANNKDIEYESGNSKATATNTWNGVKFQEVLFDETGKPQTTTNSLTVSANNHVFDIVKTQPTNAIYFTQNYSGGGFTLLNSLKITYAIDQPFTQQMPSAEGTDLIHTGDINLGKFSGSSTWGFQRDGVTDTQQVPVWVGNNGSTPTQTTPEIVKVDNEQYFVAATEGDYYIEAPAKFRIIGATVNFLSQGTSTTYKEVTSIESGKEYLISDGTNYLTLNGSSLSNTTDQSKATKWTFTSTSSGDSYTIKSGSSYLYIEWAWILWNAYTYTLKASTSSDQSWKYNDSKLQNATYSNYLAYNSDWNANTSASTIKLYEQETVSSGESGFTTTVYGRDGKTDPQENILTASNDKAIVELTGFNNDAIHFNISDLKGGKALYNVNLELMPLDPEVQKLSVGCLDGNNVTGKTTVTAENFVMATNESQTAYVIAPDKDLNTCQIAFDNAYNEQRTMWYTNGSKDNDGYSNYFLVGSAADNGGNNEVLLNADNDKYEKARVHATVAGTKKLDFTNIGEFDRTATTTNPEYLKYNEFNKTDANINAACLTLELKNTEGTTKQSDPTTVYLYVADQPTFNIMPTGSGTKHIDYRYYDITVQAIAKMTPVVKVDNILIYNSTLKGKPNKASSTLTRDEALDNNHKYVGITVTASLDGKPVNDGEGVLASTDIMDAIKEALKNYNDYCGFGENDPLRGILYLDISKLKSSDNTQLKTFDEQTADNCLYFMYPGYQAQSGSKNVITKTANAFEATSGIKIYDQQPFYTPYDFSTSTHMVNYEREGTHGKAKVTQMSCILPFDINLDGNGHPKSANDQTDTNVTFRKITSSGTLKGSLGNQEYSYAVVATKVTDDKAKANTPYHVTTEIEDGGFTFNILNAKFVKTPATTDGTEATLKDNGTTWTANGTYAGLTPAKADNRFIFASGYYRKTGAQVDNDVAYVLPFRAYFDTTDKNAAKTNAFAVVTDLNGIVTGIGSVKADGSNGLTIHAGYGCFSVTADYDTAVKAFAVGGQMVANGSISKGETVSYNVPQGVYIVNGVKVVVK